MAWGLQAGWFLGDGSRAGPPRPARQRRAGLFPLPLVTPAHLSWDIAGLGAGDAAELTTAAWVMLGCAAMNALYGYPNEGWTRRPGKMHRAVLDGLKSKVNRFLQGDRTFEGEFEKVVEDLKDKKVSYSGEEISQPHPLSVAQIEKGLPPKGHGGSVSLLPFLHGRTRFLLEHPEESLLAEDDRGACPTTAKVHIQKGEELGVFKLLEERGVISWLPAELAYSDRFGTYLSGLFRVVKPNKFTPKNLPVLRVIMNLIPINNLFEVLRGDINCLPNATQWLPICLQGNRLLCLKLTCQRLSICSRCLSSGKNTCVSTLRSRDPP